MAQHILVLIGLNNKPVRILLNSTPSSKCSENDMSLLVITTRSFTNKSLMNYLSFSTAEKMVGMKISFLNKFF